MRRIIGGWRVRWGCISAGDEKDLLEALWLDVYGLSIATRREVESGFTLEYGDEDCVLKGICGSVTSDNLLRRDSALPICRQTSSSNHSYTTRSAYASRLI